MKRNQNLLCIGIGSLGLLLGVLAVPAEEIATESRPTGQEIVQVFVTSSDFESNGNLGGLDGGDDQCNAAASSGGLSGNWTAWLSDSSADALDRIPDAEYRLLDGTVIANDLADLTDGSLDNSIDVDENGDSVDPTKVWTGTLTDGTVGLSHCSNWTSDTGVTCLPGVPNANCAIKGSSDAVDGEWTREPAPSICGLSRALYCFSESMMVSDVIFEDGFESGDTSAWSSTVP